MTRLASRSPLFRQVWTEQAVAAGTRSHKTFRHPQAGTVEMAVESLQVARARDQTLVTFNR